MKITIVSEYAVYRKPAEIADIVKEEFGVLLDRRQIDQYNPERRGKKPAAWLCEIFNTTRADFNAEKETIPIARRMYRLRELQDIHLRAKTRRNDVLSMDALKQAQKESVGGPTPRATLSELAALLDCSIDDLVSRLEWHELKLVGASYNEPSLADTAIARVMTRLLDGEQSDGEDAAHDAPHRGRQFAHDVSQYTRNKPQLEQPLPRTTTEN